MRLKLHIRLAKAFTGLQASSVPVTPPQAASEPGPSSSTPTSQDAAQEEEEKEEEKGLSKSLNISPTQAYLL